MNSVKCSWAAWEGWLVGCVAGSNGRDRRFGGGMKHDSQILRERDEKKEGGGEKLGAWIY